MKTKMNSFIKGFVAKIKGDDAVAIAEKAWRQAESFLKVEISNLEGQSVTAEIAIETAEENVLNSRLNNGELISDREWYIKNLLISQNELLEAEEELENIQNNITFFEDQLSELREEVKED